MQVQYVVWHFHPAGLQRYTLVYVYCIVYNNCRNWLQQLEFTHIGIHILSVILICIVSNTPIMKIDMVSLHKVGMIPVFQSHMYLCNKLLLSLSSLSVILTLSGSRDSFAHQYQGSGNSMISGMSQKIEFGTVYPVQLPEIFLAKLPKGNIFQPTQTCC